MFSDKEGLGNAVIKMIPRHNFVIFSAAECVESGVYAVFFKRLLPSIGQKVVFPAVKSASLSESALNNGTESSVTSCKNRLRLRRGCGEKHITCPVCKHQFDQRA